MFQGDKEYFFAFMTWRWKCIEAKILSWVGVKRKWHQLLLSWTVLLTKDNLSAKKLFFRTIQIFSVEEGKKPTRALWGTQAKSEIISLFRRKICYVGLTVFFQTRCAVWAPPTECAWWWFLRHLVWCPSCVKAAALRPASPLEGLNSLRAS